MSKYPSSWKQLPLGVVTELINGRAYKSSEWERSGTPVIRLQNLTQGGGSFYYSKLDLPKKQYCEKGDLLFMWSGSFGPYIWWGDKAIFHYHIWKMLPKDGLIEKEYLYYQLLEKTESWKAMGSGSTMTHLTKLGIENETLNIPPLPEQKKIAKILSGIDHAISTISKKQKKINLILSQLIIDSTTPQGSSAWRETTIGENVDFQGGSQPPRSTFKFAPEEGYIRMLQIRDYKSDSRATYIPLNLCRRFCDKEDVMIGRYGPPNFQILRGKEGSYNVALIKAIPKNEKELKKEYLFRFLQRRDLFLLMNALAQRTSGQQGLDMDALKEFPISLPDPSMQEHICKSLAAIESISLELQHRKQSLCHLKSGISDQLLSGRKRVHT